MAEVTDYDNVPAEDEEGETPGEDSSPGANGDAGGGDDKAHIGGTQAGIIEMSTLITQPGLKRAESMEILHLTLHQCARDGNPDNMRRLLQSMSGHVKKKVNLHDDEDLSALHYASRYNHVHLVRMLVEHGANVNDTDEEGASPLHFAARYKRIRLRSQSNAQPAQQLSGDGKANNADGDLPELQSTPENSVILFMVDRGADVNARDIYGCTPLHFASMRGNELATQELLNCRGVNIEAVDKQQMAAIHLAASHNETEVCRMLIDKGANLRCCDEDLCTPLHYACMEGNELIAQLLFEAGEKQDGWVTVSQMVTDQDNQQNTALHLAVEHKSYTVAKLCIDKGADVNTPSDNYSTPLHTAAVVGNVDVTRLLLDHTARIDALDVNQCTPLHRAAAYNHADVCEFLLERGAKIDKHDKDNFTPLLIAACNGHADTIKTLLTHGADLFAVDKNDKTAIFWAAEEDHVEALQTLLGQTQNVVHLVDEDDRFGNTPLHIASTMGHVNCARALLDAGADLDAKNEEEQTPLHLAAKNGKTSVVRELVKRDKMTINDEDEDSNTPLHLSALSGHNKAVSALIDAGAFIDARNCSLWTPLDCAAAKGWAKTCKVLLEADAPIDPMDKTKTTPLHLASAKGHVRVVVLLLQWNASVAQRDTEGRNCLDLAIDNGHQDVAMGIINSSKWKEALRNETIDLKTGLRNTPMRRLIRKMPDVAESVFNLCTTRNVNNPDALNYQITFNYEFLDDMYADWREVSDTGSDAMSTLDSIYDEDDAVKEGVKAYSQDSNVLKRNHPMYLMVMNQREDLLAHPLATSLLRHKWDRFGKWVYYSNLLFYCVFLVFLTGYVCTTTPPFNYFYITKDGYNASSLCEAVKDYYEQSGEGTLTQELFAYIGKYVIMAMAAFNILREIFQMYNAKLNYLGWENLIEWVTYVCALLLVIDWNTCQQETGIREDWQWQIAAVAIFMAWLELVLFIRKFPRFGIYVVMFTDILITFLQFFPVFLLFLVAFSLAFYVLLANQYAFRQPEYSMIKTTVMMIGEMEFQDLFFGTEDLTDSEELHKNKVYYEPLTYVLYAVFLVIMTLLIMNLLIGLAVDDIKAVQEQAVLKRLAMQVELALDVESLLPQFIRRKYVIKCKKVEPNLPSPNPFIRCFKIDSSMSSQAITKALDPDLDEMEVLQENQEKMLNEMNTMRYRQKQMEMHNQKMNLMMTALMKHHGITYDEEDAQEEDFMI